MAELVRGRFTAYGGFWNEFFSFRKFSSSCCSAGVSSSRRRRGSLHSTASSISTWSLTTSWSLRTVSWRSATLASPFSFSHLILHCSTSRAWLLEETQLTSLRKFSLPPGEQVCVKSSLWQFWHKTKRKEFGFSSLPMLSCHNLECAKAYSATATKSKIFTPFFKYVPVGRLLQFFVDRKIMY